MIYMGVGILMLMLGTRLLLGGTSYVYFGAGIYFDFGEYGAMCGFFFLMTGVVFIRAAMNSFRDMR